MWHSSKLANAVTSSYANSYSLILQDFRSEDGLYSLIQAHRDGAISGKILEKRTPLSARPHTNSPLAKRPTVPNNIKGKDLFDSQLWKDTTSTSVFYTFIASLRKTIREEVKRSTPTHRFIKTIRDQRKLVRCYTQNIDGLESREGLTVEMARGRGNRARFTKQALEKPNAVARLQPGGDLDGGCEVVQLHGDLEVLRCTLCQQTCQWQEKDEARLLGGKAPICHFCNILNEDRQVRGKRGTKVGTLRPNVVLYGEQHPSADAVGKITTHDLALSPDLLLILGTSLHVHGLKILVKEFAKAVHARAGGKGKVVFVNLSKPSDSAWKDVIDYWVSMDCDEWVGAMRRHRSDIWQIQRELKPAGSKGLNKTVTKAIASPQCAGKPIQDKENVPTDQSAVVSPKIPRPMVVVTPKKKSPLQDLAFGFMSQIRQVAANLTPSRTTAEQESSQLPTPPSTGPRSKFQKIPEKRPRSDDDDLLATPSKRRKPTISIWEDPSSGTRRRQIHRY